MKIDETFPIKFAEGIEWCFVNFTLKIYKKKIPKSSKTIKSIKLYIKWRLSLDYVRNKMIVKTNSKKKEIISLIKTRLDLNFKLILYFSQIK